MKISELKQLISDVPDDFEFEIEVRKRIPDDVLATMSYPFPDDTETCVTERGNHDIAWSEKQIQTFHKNTRIMNDLSANFENQGCVVSYSRNKGRMYEHLKQMYDLLREVESTKIFVLNIEKYGEQFKKLNNTELSYTKISKGLYEISILKQ